VVVVAVLQEDLAEGAVAQTQGAFAIGVADLHRAAEMVAIEEQVAWVGAAHAASFEFAVALPPCPTSDGCPVYSTLLLSAANNEGISIQDKLRSTQ